MKKILIITMLVYGFFLATLASYAFFFGFGSGGGIGQVIKEGQEKGVIPGPGTNNTKKETNLELTVEIIAPYSESQNILGASKAKFNPFLYSFNPIPPDPSLEGIVTPPLPCETCEGVKPKLKPGEVSFLSLPESNTYAIGEKYVWVILVEFPDWGHLRNDTHCYDACNYNESTPEYWRDKLFGDTLVENLQSGSELYPHEVGNKYPNPYWVQTDRTMRNYFRVNSYGKLSIKGEIVNNRWHMVEHNMAYYVNKWCELANDALAVADPDFDFSSYNEDGNDTIILIIHAGPAAESAGSSTLYIWSKSSNDCVAQYGRGVSADGRTITRISTVSEVQGNKYQIFPAVPTTSCWAHPFGIICHEFAHLLGMPDIYPSSAFYNWDLMDAGYYSSNGDIPNFCGAWMCLWNNWVVPQVILPGSTADVILTPHFTTTGNKIVKIPVGTENSEEYFLLENRQQWINEWDWETIYGYILTPLDDGILVWHIKDSLGNAGTPRSPGNPNNNPPFGRRIFIEDKLVTNPPVIKTDYINAAYDEGYEFSWNSALGTNSTMRDTANLLSNQGGPRSGVSVYNIRREGRDYRATVKNSLLPNQTFKAAVKITNNSSKDYAVLSIDISADTWIICPIAQNVNVSPYSTTIIPFTFSTSPEYSDSETKTIWVQVAGKTASASVITATDVNGPNP